MTALPDCVVIGGGVMGCAIAWRLARRGVRVKVLERSIPGAEASSAAGGILAAQEEARGPSPLVSLGLASRARFASISSGLLEETGIDIGHRTAGVMSVAFDAQQRAALEDRYAWMPAQGLPMTWLSGDEARLREPALHPNAHSALLFSEDAQVVPGAYLRALADAAAKAGAEFVSGCQVTGISVSSGRATGVELASGHLAADRVVLAAGSWSQLVANTGLRPGLVRPVRGQMVSLETRPRKVFGTIVAPGGGYVVGRADGSTLMGSTVEEAGFEKRVTAAGLAAVLAGGLALTPSLGDTAVVGTWANFRPTTPDGLPLLGPSAVDGLLLATGHYRHGILQSAITADIVEALVTGEASPIDLAPFSVHRFGESA